jgi:uncharacterized protein
MISITPVYAALLALLFIVLTVGVIRQRRMAGVSLGDGGDRRLLRRLRAHANFAEYVPLTLFLMLTVELQQAQPWFLHAVGLCLVTGRGIHAYAVSGELEPLRLRVVGMALTIAALSFGAIGNLVLVLERHGLA